MAGKHTKQCTIRDLAKYVGLSICTVSKSLNDTDEGNSIPEATRKMVREAAAKLNYVPNVNAQRLFRRRSQVVGLLVPAFQDETENTVFLDQHLALIIGGMSDALLKSNYHLMLLFNSPQNQERGRYESMFRSHLLDGLLVWGIQQDDFYWKELVNIKTPTLFLTTTPESMSRTSFNYVSNDYEYAGYEAAKKLFSQGCTKPLWLMPQANTSVRQEYEHGIRRAMLESGCPAGQLTAMPCEYSRFKLTDILKKLESCDSVIALSDNVARSLSKLQIDLGLHLPMVCLDAAENCIVPNVPTLVPQDKLIGKFAIETILQMIDTPVEKISPIQKRFQGQKVGF